MTLFLEDPTKYYTKYFLGIQEPETNPMVLGKALHSAVEDPLYNYREALALKGFTPNHADGIAKALKGFRRPKAREVELYAPLTATVSAYGIIDGLKRPSKTLCEWKTGRAWTQRDVDNHEQLDFYAYLVYRNYGYVPKIELVHFDLKKGKRTTFKTIRTLEQIRAMEAKILATVELIDNTYENG
jgi:hypothetical protein